MSSPYSEDGGWLVQHIIDEGFDAEHVAAAAMIDLGVVVSDSDRPAVERAALAREVLEAARGTETGGNR